MSDSEPGEKVLMQYPTLLPFKTNFDERQLTGQLIITNYRLEIKTDCLVLKQFLTMPLGFVLAVLHENHKDKQFFV